MTTRNKRVRFMENNLAALTNSTVDYSSQLTANPFSNTQNSFRTKSWTTEGYFEITSSNQELYINDGSDKTVSITIGEYTSPSSLATQIQTDLNAASSNWTVTYSSTTYKFTISNSGSVTLRYSQTSNSIWDTLGYTGSTNTIGTSFVADEQRNHTEEHAIYDFGYQANITFVALIGSLDEVFSISDAATITLEANNINTWTSPAYTQSLTRSSGGVFRFLDDTTDTKYRYWKIKIVDKYNTSGPEGISISHIYLGDYITSTSRNIQRRFNKVLTDPSAVSSSESGVLYFDEKTKYITFNNMEMRYLTRTDKDAIETMYSHLGTTTPFYISLDPIEQISDDIDEFTRYVIFEREPVFTHIHDDTFSVSLEMREII